MGLPPALRSAQQRTGRTGRPRRSIWYHPGESQVAFNNQCASAQATAPALQAAAAPQSDPFPFPAAESSCSRAHKRDAGSAAAELRSWRAASAAAGLAGEPRGAGHAVQGPLPHTHPASCSAVSAPRQPCGSRRVPPAASPTLSNGWYCVRFQPCAPPTRPTLQLHYRTSWQQPVLHHSVNGGEWRGVEMQQVCVGAGVCTRPPRCQPQPQDACLAQVSAYGLHLSHPPPCRCTHVLQVVSGTGWWTAAQLQLDVAVAHSALGSGVSSHASGSGSPAPLLEFVITDGQHAWDKAPDGANYMIADPGRWRLSGGKLAQAATPPVVSRGAWRRWRVCVGACRPWTSALEQLLLLHRAATEQPALVRALRRACLPAHMWPDLFAFLSAVPSAVP